MRDYSIQFMKLALFGCLIALSPAALADNGSGPDTSQTGSLVNNYNSDSQGSDNSLRYSSVYIMQALMDLNKTDFVGAVKNGYQAYGKYRNAENLDRLKDQSAQLANAMGSVGNNPLYTSTTTNTTFARLDPSFLHQGNADTISAEFERETGMKREDFLAQIGSISDQKIKRSDPMMMDKALSRFESFIQKIPNAEFRKNAEKNIALVPDSMRRGMISQAVSKLAGYFADAGPATNAPFSNISELAKGKLPDGKELSSADAGKSATDSSRAPAAVDNAGVTTAATPGAHGKTGAEGAVAAALFTQGQDGAASEDTIFQQVTKRYRILTPQFQVAHPAN